MKPLLLGGNVAIILNMKKNNQPLILGIVVIGTVLIIALALALIFTRGSDDITTETANENNASENQESENTEEKNEEEMEQESELVDTDSFIVLGVAVTEDDDYDDFVPLPCGGSAFYCTNLWRARLIGLKEDLSGAQLDSIWQQ